MLALLRTTISDEEMVDIIRVLVDKAKNGDTSAAKILLSYKIGKPAPAPNPDQIDRDEWEHYQKDTINLQEVQQVLSSLPAKVGNDIARTALPIVTKARVQQLTASLGAGLEGACEAAVATVSNGNSATQTSSTSRELAETNSVQHEGSGDAERVVVNSAKKRSKEPAPHSTSRSPSGAARAAQRAPIANGKRKHPKHSKAGRKRVRPAWLQPIADQLKQGSKMR
jgi:hypothetical protein